jgi:hypothetical protein
MLKFLLNLLGGGWRVEDRLQEEQDRRHFGQYTFVLVLMVIFPVSCGAAASISNNGYVGLICGVAAIAVPSWTARAFDRLLRAFGFSAPFAGGWSRTALVLMWISIVGASLLYFKLSGKGTVTVGSGITTQAPAPAQPPVH